VRAFGFWAFSLRQLQRCLAGFHHLVNPALFKAPAQFAVFFECPVVFLVELAIPDFFQRLADLDKGLFAALDNGFKFLQPRLIDLGRKEIVAIFGRSWIFGAHGVALP
jgi:hypothetical protein